MILVCIGLTAAAAQLMMTYAYRQVKVSTGSLIGMLVPVCNVILGITIFSEEISLRVVIGILIVELFLASFNNLIQIQLNMDYMAWYTIPGLLVLGIIMGFLSGTYSGVDYGDDKYWLFYRCECWSSSWWNNI